MTDAPAAKICSRCHAAPARPGQRWCASCHLAYKRERGASGITGGNAVSQKAGNRQETLPGQNGADWIRPPTPPADLQPLNSVADKWDGWRGAYLRHLVATGQRVKGAAVAGVSRRELQQRIDEDPDFAEAIETAMGEYLDGCETALVATSNRGNPVGLIVRLKAGRPAAYIERSASINVTADLNQRPPIDATALLKALLGNTTDTTRRMLGPDARLEDAPRPEAP